MIILSILVALSLADQAPVYEHLAPYDQAAYSYKYAVKDDYSGVDIEAEEKREGAPTSGSYKVALPDGRTQLVSYSVADAHSGYVADVSYSGEAQYVDAPSYKPAPAPYKPTTTLYKPTQAPYKPITLAYKPTPVPVAYKPLVSTLKPAAYKPNPTYAPVQASYRTSPSSYQPASSTYKPVESSYEPALTSYEPAPAASETIEVSYKPEESEPASYGAEEGEGNHAPTLFRHAVV